MVIGVIRLMALTGHIQRTVMRLRLMDIRLTDTRLQLTVIRRWGHITAVITAAIGIAIGTVEVTKDAVMDIAVAATADVEIAGKLVGR